MNSSQNPQGQEIGRGKVSLRGKLSKEGFDRQQLDNIEKLGNKPINVSDALKSKDSGRPKDKVPTNVKREPWPKRLFGSKKDSEDGAENNQAEGQPAQSSDNQKRDENQESEDHGEGQQEKANVEEQNQTQQDESQIQEQAEDQAQEEGQEAQHLKFTDRLKKQFSDFRKKQAENLKKKLSKEIIKKALLALVSNPYFWAAVAIFILILIIASSCSRQSGKTPYLSLERGKDDTLVLKFLAAAGEKGAQRELISKQAVATKDELKKINITDPEGKKIVDQINVLLDEIVTLADNTNAVQERVNKINELLNKLDQYVPKNSPSPGTPSTSPSTTQKSAIDVASAADAAPTPSTAANSALTSVRAKVNEMPKMISYYERGHLVVNPKDIDYARNYNLDRRVIQMLVYLVTPTDQSGAGHERIKVNRIKFSYDTERKSISKETDFADKEEPNISAHFSGQAADITEIDYIKCTEIKRRRLLKDKKRKLPPIPIKVAWQSEEGYAKTGGPEAFGQNMHELFKNLGTGAVNDLLIAEIADALGIELDPTKLKGMSLGEMTKYIGTAYLKSQLDIPGDYELGSDFNDIVTNIGRSYLAQAIGVPVEGIQGGTPDEITENVGRAILEQKLGLVAGSLAGNNSEEIFSSAGRRKIEDSLNISRSALAVSYSDAAGFQRAVGQGRVEKSLGIKPQTFFGTNLADLKKRLTKELFDVTFADPETIDNWLGIADGSTDNLISGKISPDAFNSIVGAKVIEKELNIYKAEDKRAEAFDVSVSDLQGMSVGNKSSFVGMGKYTIAKAFTASDPERELFISWFNSRTKPSNLDVDYLGGQRGLRPGDIDKIFISDLGNQVFRRLGKVEIINNLEDNPQIAQSLEPVKEIRFYTDRLNIIQDNFRALKNNASDNEIKAKAQESENIISGLLSDLSVKSIQDKTKQLQSNLKYIQDHSQKDDPRTQDRVRAIEKALAEIIEGRELNDFDSYSAGSITAKTDPQVGLTKKDVIAVLMGKKKLEDLVVNIGMAKWENELDLPAGTLTETYKGLKDSGLGSIDEILLISIGKTKVKEYGGANRGSADQVDRDLNISSGTTADYRAGKMTENAYYKKVGLAVGNNIAANLINKQLGLGNDPFYALNGNDITKLMSGGWFGVVLKLGGKAIDEALDFPAGGTLDIIKQSNKPGDVLELLAEKKLGLLAGIDRPVSLQGDIPFNLGLAKIEQYLGITKGELNEGNLVQKIRDYTGSNDDNMSRLDVSLGVGSGNTKKLVGGSYSAHDYIARAGNYIKDSVIYDFIAQYAPDLKNKDLKALVMALAEKTGSPEEIMQGAGAKRIGEMLGLDVPVSIRGNLKDNIGAAAIEDRLGFKPGTFKDSLDTVVTGNSQNRVEAAFHILNGKLPEARKADSGYWNEDAKNSIKLIDANLNITTGSTFDFVTGKIDIGTYIDRVGKSMLLSVTVDKLTDLMGVEDNYKTGIVAVVSILQTDPSISSAESKKRLYQALTSMTGLDLDSKVGFTPGTFEKIFFVNPNDPDHTGLKHAGTILLEEGKKWVPKMLGMDAQWDPYIDLIYEQASGLNDLEAMKDAIKQITGIPDDADAYRLLKGDLKGGLYAWGASQMVKAYNEEFKGTNSQLDYYTVRNAFFNTPEFDKKTGDEAVAKFKQECGGCEISPDVEQSIRDDAVHEAKTKLQKDIQYAIVDMQLHSRDKNIPPGFTKALREGTPEEKWTMGLTYIGNMLHDQNSSIPPEILNDLNKYFDPNSPNFHNPSALSASTLSFLDTQMKTWFGSFIQPGTAKALFEFGKTGQLGSPSDQGSLTQIYANYGINIICNWGDTKMGLPAGTTKMIYDYFTKYQAALAQYNTARAAYEAGKATAAAADLKKAMNAEAAAATQIKAEFYTFVVTKVFAKQLRVMEEKLGLVPGSSDLLVSAAVQYLMSTGNPIITLAIFVAWNLFGVYRIDVICSACGYYPEMDNPLGLSCPLSDFDGKESGSFRQGTITAAQWKVKQVIGESLNMSKSLNDANMLPTQIMTLRQEDVDAYASQLNSDYGAANARGNSGLWSNKLMWDHIHIGF